MVEKTFEQKYFELLKEHEELKTKLNMSNTMSTDVVSALVSDLGKNNDFETVVENECLKRCRACGEKFRWGGKNKFHTKCLEKMKRKGSYCKYKCGKRVENHSKHMCMLKKFFMASGFERCACDGKGRFNMKRHMAVCPTLIGNRYFKHMECGRCGREVMVNKKKKKYVIERRDKNGKLLSKEELDSPYSHPCRRLLREKKNSRLPEYVKCKNCGHDFLKGVFWAHLGRKCKFKRIGEMRDDFESRISNKNVGIVKEISKKLEELEENKDFDGFVEFISEKKFEGMSRVKKPKLAYEVKLRENLFKPVELEELDLVGAPKDSSQLVGHYFSLRKSKNERRKIAFLRDEAKRVMKEKMIRGEKKEKMFEKEVISKSKEYLFTDPTVFDGVASLNKKSVIENWGRHNVFLEGWKNEPMARIFINKINALRKELLYGSEEKEYPHCKYEIKIENVYNYLLKLNKN